MDVDEEREVADSTAWGFRLTSLIPLARQASNRRMAKRLCRPPGKLRDRGWNPGAMSPGHVLETPPISSGQTLSRTLAWPDPVKRLVLCYKQQEQRECILHLLVSTMLWIYTRSEA